MAARKPARLTKPTGLRGSPEAQHDPGEPIDPTVIRKAGPECSFQGAMKPLTQPISLGVISGCSMEPHTQAPGDRIPQLGSELRSPVRGDIRRVAETG